MKISKKKQNIISAAIIVLGTVFSFLIFGPDKSHSQENANVSAKPAAIVKTIVLGDETGKFATLQKSAMFESSNSSQVVSEFSGKVSLVGFEVGDFVTEGQILVVFDQSDDENAAKVSFQSAQEGVTLALDSLDKTKLLVEENLEIAKNARKIAEIQLDQAEDDDDKDAVELAERGLSNAKDLEDQAEESAKLQVNSAEQRVSQARASLDQARIAYENTIIKAPTSGLISSKNVKTEDFLNFGQTVAEIVGTGRLETTISLNENQIDRVMIGDHVLITFGEEHVEGEVVSLSPVANSSNQRFDVKIETKQDYAGKANSTGVVTLDLLIDSSKENNFFVPLEAVSIGQKRTSVFIVVDGSAANKEVALGEVIGSQVEIVEGLSLGDEVVILNNKNLQDGQNVEIEK